jgi:hypothetical protein
LCDAEAHERQKPNNLDLGESRSDGSYFASDLIAALAVFGDAAIGDRLEKMSASESAGSGLRMESQVPHQKVNRRAGRWKKS